MFRHLIPRFPVVWVNGVGHRVPRLDRADLLRAVQKVRSMLQRQPGSRPEDLGDHGDVAPHRVVEPKVLPWHHWPGVHALNTRSLVRSIRGALASLGLSRPPVVVSGSPPTVGVLGRLGELGSVYFCMDEYLSMDITTPEMLGPLEQRMLGRVDVLVATAEVLTHTKRPRSGVAYHLPQGVSYDHFASPLPSPEDLERLPRPILGFAGYDRTRLDRSLLMEVADRRPGWSIVLVGPTEEERGDLDRPNVHFLGRRTYDLMPAYVQAFDVGIVPYRITEETVAVDPLKLLEYAAAGLPVVTTDLPEARKYPDIAAVTDSVTGFIDAVEQAYAEPRDAVRERSQSVARANTWEARSERFLEIAMDRFEIVS